MIREFFRKVQLFLLLTLGTYPALAIVCVFFAPEQLMYVWRLSAVFFGVGCLSLLLPAVLRYPVCILGAAAMLAPAFLFATQEVSVILCAVCGGLLIWYAQIRCWDPGQELSGIWLAGCLVASLVGYFLSYYEPLLAPVAVFLRVSLFAYVFLAMCSLNRSSLYLASGGKDCISGRMRRNNLLLVIGMFLLAALVAVITSRYRIFKTLGSLLAMLLAKLSALFGNVVDKTTDTTVMTELTVPPTTMPMATGLGGAGDMVYPVAPLNKTLIVVYVLAVLLGGVFTFAVIVAAGTKRSKKARTATHYEDEITSTRKESGQRRQREVQKEEQIPGWLSPTKRIRRRYKRLMEQHPQWHKSSTARENLVEEAAKIYEKTRYSSHTVTKQDADEFKNKTK